MFFIPGWLISILTFPGVIIHEWAHKKYCDWTGVRVHQVVYFRVGNPAGFVLHEQPKLYSQVFWISTGPLIINSFLAIVISFLATQAQPESILYYVLYWIAISAGMHAFPSDQDTKYVLEASKYALKNGGSFFHYLAYPFFGLIWLANKLRIIWFDFWYAAALVAFGGIAL
ncbi:MAG: metalloprotease family protein [Patescibacteria group bacterium]|nr:metalloprotease family protein [Patescibacteria group bacterium]